MAQNAGVRLCPPGAPQVWQQTSRTSTLLVHCFANAWTRTAPKGVSLRAAVLQSVGTRDAERSRRDAAEALRGKARVTADAQPPVRCSSCCGRLRGARGGWGGWACAARAGAPCSAWSCRGRRRWASCAWGTGRTTWRRTSDSVMPRQCCGATDSELACLVLGLARTTTAAGRRPCKSAARRG